MITFIFPGQGSQSKGMGGELFDDFKEITAQADKILGYSIKELCLEDPNMNLSQTQYTQPALYIVNALTYLKKVEEIGEKPDFVAGHSLGEYNALFAAGGFDFTTGLRMVKKRGELMSYATGGGMAAVIGLNEDQIADVLRQNNLQHIDMANYNSPTQIVISGLKADIDNAKSVFESIKDVQMFIPLKTSGAFHSRYMTEAKREFEVFLDEFGFGELTIPVISNVYARPYKQSDIKKNLIEQITCPVQWNESIRYLMGIGQMEFEELGPGKVLTGLVRRIKKEATPLVVMVDEDNVDNVDNVVEKEELIAVSKPDVMNDSGVVLSALENQAISIEEVSAESEISKKQMPHTIDTVTNAPVLEKKDILRVQSEYKEILPISLGNFDFKKDYSLKFAYLSGGMYQGIASKEMVVKMGKAGMMGFLGTGGLNLSQIQVAVEYIQKELSEGQAYGVNMLHNLDDPEMEESIVDLLINYGVTVIEAAAFLNITTALVKFRAKGLTQDKNGNIIIRNKIIAKVSRPEVAEVFLSPAPERIITKLLSSSKITQMEADLLKRIPMADDICAEADSGGHTDGRTAYTLMPAIIKLRDEMMEKYNYSKSIRVGAAGGIGTPEAAAAAFILGADFIVTGSINQCTVEASTSDAVKDLLQQMNVQDTQYAPAGDMFELGAKVQVLKRGVFFPARANKLYELYRQYDSIDEIDEKTKIQIQDKYFKRSFERVYEEVKSYYSAYEIEKAEQNPKHKMALIFKWYFGYSSRLALTGSEESKIDYQIHCSPALGAFNQWVKGSVLENWKNRHVDEIAMKLIKETAAVLNQRYNNLLRACQ